MAINGGKPLKPGWYRVYNEFDLFPREAKVLNDLWKELGVRTVGNPFVRNVHVAAHVNLVKVGANGKVEDVVGYGLKSGFLFGPSMRTSVPHKDEILLHIDYVGSNAEVVPAIQKAIQNGFGPKTYYFIIPHDCQTFANTVKGTVQSMRQQTPLAALAGRLENLFRKFSDQRPGDSTAACKGRRLDPTPQSSLDVHGVIIMKAPEAPLRARAGSL
jgi:hypothetical protein